MGTFSAESLRELQSCNADDGYCSLSFCLLHPGAGGNIRPREVLILMANDC